MIIKANNKTYYGSYPSTRPPPVVIHSAYREHIRLWETEFSLELVVLKADLWRNMSFAVKHSVLRMQGSHSLSLCSVSLCLWFMAVKVGTVGKVWPTIEGAAKKGAPSKEIQALAFFSLRLFILFYLLSSCLGRHCRKGPHPGVLYEHFHKCM